MNLGIIENKYVLIRKLGEGNFGKVFLAKNINTENYVAIKIEWSKTPLLKYEARIYTLLKNNSYVPKLRSFGRHDDFYYMVIDYLPFSITDRLIERGGKLEIHEVSYIAKQLIECLKCLHECKILHRDIKPENIMLKNNKIKNSVCLIDFGLCSIGKNIKNVCGQKMIGTPNYVSVNVHNGYVPSYVDDLESLGYVLIYLHYGFLPWENENSQIKHHMKRNIHKFDVNEKIIKYMNELRNVPLNIQPNYETIYNIFV
tara:strand:+ start:5192 stop:5962 length:771 start_codon:yes stop_codon:yes gene_type:complete